MTYLPVTSADIGVVVIGRNEGQRLIDCLASVSVQAENIVYVDSGSTDGSLTMAEQMGASVVRLDLALPFTAARARNEGFAALMKVKPSTRFVQFVDGDCELVLGWLNKAHAFICERNDVAVVCGRRRERYPRVVHVQSALRYRVGYGDWISEGMWRRFHGTGGRV